jgi:cytidine deaminase
MREFCDDDFLVYIIGPEGYETQTLAELLPHSFSSKKMN